MSNDAMAEIIFGSAMSIFQLVFWVIYTIVLVLMVIALWKVFVKAGEPGWACLIPFYGWWVLMKISCKNTVLWFILMFIPFVNFVAVTVSLIGLAKSFGKGTGTILLMIFLPFIGLPMLAFGDAEWDPDLRFGEY